MNTHKHLSSEEIFERISEGESLAGLSGCETCEAEGASLSRLMADLKAVDSSLVSTTEWDDLLLRSRIREAVAKEKPHSPSIFERFPLLRPAFAAALVAALAVAVWSPLSRFANDTDPSVASFEVPSDRLPAWTPLPDMSEDQGLAVLAEWTPSEEELTIARCRAACLAGLTSQEEEHLFRTVAQGSARVPMTGPSPL